MNTTHRWNFFRACGLTQVLFKDGEDFRRLRELDQKLWVAIGVPLKHLCFDKRTLELIDVDNDGHIRPPELLDAVDWCTSRIKDAGVLLDDSGVLRLDNIDESVPEGAALLSAAKLILASLGCADSETISLEQVADRARIFAQTRFNGDGIVPESSAANPAVAAAIRDILACVGGETDRSGQPGVNQEKLDAFFAAAEAYAAWRKAGAAADVLPLGDSTAAAADALEAVRAKVDDFFARCRIVAFDARSAEALNRDAAAFGAIAGESLTVDNPDVADLPLAFVAADAPLPLDEGVNPAWAARLAAFRDSVVKPLLGASGDSRPATLSEAQWHDLCATFAPVFAWRGAKTGSEVEPLGLPRVEELLASGHRDAIARLIERDSVLASENAGIQDVEKLLLFVKNLNRLLHNFVNFSDYYDPEHPETFRAGRLHLDARTSDLCVYVDDVAAHSALAAASNICLVYCDISRPGTGTKKAICAPFTAGFAATLSVGRNGIFYDNDGKDWDARVTKIVDHPISLREAFWNPWRKIGKMIGDQVTKILGSKQDAALAAVSTNVEKAAAIAADPAAAPVAAPVAAPPAKTGMEGVAAASSVAAIGVAVGLVGSAVGGLVQLVTGIPLWKTLAGIGGVILAVSGPSMILTYFRLRARDFAPVLNAAGWAINTKLPMTMRLGAEFTREASLPKGSRIAFKDPYQDSRWLSRTLWTLLALAILAFATYKVVERYPGHPWSRKIRFWASEPATAEAEVPVEDAAPGEAAE
ncbi:MAG: hypothetical protein ACOX5G_01540 [Kiritimatiellia bacterium]|jgi:hypothetical protein